MGGGGSSGPKYLDPIRVSSYNNNNNRNINLLINDPSFINETFKNKKKEIFDNKLLFLFIFFLLFAYTFILILLLYRNNGLF